MHVNEQFLIAYALFAERGFRSRLEPMAMVGVGSTPLWLSRALYADDAPSPRKKILVAIFQRGAVDGLNVVVPHGEQRYYDLRPTIACLGRMGRRIRLSISTGFSDCIRR